MRLEDDIYCEKCGSQMKKRIFSGFFYDENKFSIFSGKKMEPPTYVELVCPRFCFLWRCNRYVLSLYADNELGEVRRFEL